MGDEEKKPPKKPYETPIATQLTREQAKLKLMGRAMMGSEEAKELLDVLFAQENPHPEKRPYEKPTATRLTREQARMRLMGQAMIGSRAAKELLEILFKEENQVNDDMEDKKSA
jgi:hypothetical protein